MPQILQYRQVETLQEAYELLQQNRNNLILGGMMWLRMQERTIPVAIDLKKLNLDQIEEQEDCFIIGAMTSLRQLETHAGLQTWFGSIIKDSIQDIVGVQFRNGATLGGSLYSRFGFSDLLTAFSVLPCEVELYHGGRIDIKDFAKASYERDIVTHVIVHKKKQPSAFTCVRKSATDLPVLNMAASRHEDHWLIAVGSRPQKAMTYTWPLDMPVLSIAKEMEAHVEVGDNMRGSAAYRKKLVYACALRLLTALSEEEKTCR